MLLFTYFVETIQMYKFKGLRNCFGLEPYKEILFPAIQRDSVYTIPNSFLHL